MVLPGVLILFCPLILGGLFGPKAIFGYLVGIIVSSVHMSISSTNSGEAWDSSKKFIENGGLKIGKFDEDYSIEDPDIIEEMKQLSKWSEKNKLNNHKIQLFDIKSEEIYCKGSKPYKAAIITDSIGNALKVNGSNLNILIKLSAMISFMFGSFFIQNAIFKF